MTPCEARAQQIANPQAAIATSGAPEQLTLGDLPEMAAQEAAQPASAISGSLHGMPPLQYLDLKAERAAKQAAAPKTGSVANSPLPLPAPPDSGLLTPTKSISFGGATEGCGMAFPPDMALAVGPTHVMQVINGCVVVFNKSGATLPGFPKRLNTFLGEGSAQFPFDPRALYDWANNRYIVSAARFNNASRAAILDVAVSQTSNPMGGWHIYHINLVGAKILATGDLADYPTLGQDRRAIYVSFNDFAAGTTFAGSRLLLLPKAKMYGGAPIGSFWYFLIPTLDSLQPANVMNLGDNPRAEFVVSTPNFVNSSCHGLTGCNTLIINAVSNPLFVSPITPPEFSQVTIATVHSYFLPPAAMQPGCTSGPCLIDTGDVRISGEVTYASGSLYGALTTDGTGSGKGEAHFMWFQVKPFLNDNNNTVCPLSGPFANKCPDIIGAEELNEVCYGCTSGFLNAGAVYYPTVQPDPEGNVTVVFNYSDDASLFPSAGYSSNRVTQALGNMHDAGKSLQAGLALYQALDTSNLNRWGDYTAAAVDLTPGTMPSFWLAGESSRTATTFRTAVGRNAYTSVNQP
jgi:hypothetical protein